MKLDKLKLILELERIMSENQKHIDNDNDSDEHCKLENDTIDNIIHWINSGEFDIK